MTVGAFKTNNHGLYIICNCERHVPPKEAWEKERLTCNWAAEEWPDNTTIDAPDDTLVIDYVKSRRCPKCGCQALSVTSISPKLIPNA
jgi:hypothetical protein